MFEGNKIEKTLVEKIAKLMSVGKRDSLEQAATFATYIVPNKAFVDHPAMIEVAEDLVERMETEISSLKSSSDPARDELLSAARQFKKDIRGFLIHERKGERVA